MNTALVLTAYYDALSAHFGPSHWWPAESPFETAVGAVLTQNTAWRNVEKALVLLKERDALTPAGMARLASGPPEAFEDALRPSGYFRVKARRLGNLLEWMRAFPGWDAEPEGASLAFAAHLPTDALRSGLLGVVGIGPETADCIVLYAFRRPSFVVDAYTRRICGRHGLMPESVGYEELRAFFMRALPPRRAAWAEPLYNEYHALIVRTGHTYCRKTNPRCSACPLGAFLPQ